jgi:hypothetical protein
MPSGESMCVIRQGQSLRYQVDQRKGVQIVWYANCLIKAAEQVLSDFAIILGYFASNLKGLFIYLFPFTTEEPQQNGVVVSYFIILYKTVHLMADF